MAVRFAVKGRGGFPLDMLRHDQCYPATSEDAHLIGEVLDYARETPGPHEVTLYCNQDRAFGTPNERRWASFGWKVKNVERYR